ncbi:MAG TPA: hypothetical protein VG502_10825 [Flexivirga sp.]|uniref:MmyB family transcriptional regulator n=1 Tax=Flexivirga sp. TaxID=1962927 RepID=UPI002BB25D85|nr:hypothetical protein [Flexivirga sp.]HWC22781.1 hypothetical protein [Flexivirga sp.]
MPGLRREEVAVLAGVSPEWYTRLEKGHIDIVASNALGAALYSPVLDNPANRRNIARFDFLDARAADYYPDHDGALSVAVALLRTEAGRNARDPALTELVGELATQSEAFRTRWAAHDVRAHKGGVKTFNHPQVGYLELAYDSMELVAAPGLVLTAYTAEPGTRSADSLNLLASLAATETADPAGRRIPSSEGDNCWN